MSTDFRDRPSMLDKYGGRLPLYPAEVRGPWRARRSWVQGVLIFVFLFLPWLKINGAPAVQLDVEQHRLAFFGIKLWAHDGPLLFLFLGIFAVGLALMTALIGRAWCGWACPQTVFLDGVIRRIERWTEGSHLKRRELDAGPWTFGKIRKKTTKWILFALFTAILTHSLLAYFVGTERVLAMMTDDPRRNPGAFLFILVLNGLMLFDLAWFREQFCLIVCPYGRIQSVLMDSQTVAVQYDVARGEPRKAKGLEKHGACVSCNRCVSVCPTGIDIRNGIQLECISCTACIDACDDVMKKTNQPPGLIRHRASSDQPIRWLRSRVLTYAAVLALMITGLFLALSTRQSILISLLRAHDVPYFEQVAENGPVIVNSYRMHAHNQTPNDIRMTVSAVPGEDRPVLRIPESMLLLRKDESRMIPFTVEFSKTDLKGRTVIPVRIQIQDTIYEVEFVAPRS